MGAELSFRGMTLGRNIQIELEIYALNIYNIGTLEGEHFYD